MQTLAVNVQDEYVGNFMNYVNNSNSNVTITKDENLEYDPHFYDRQKKLQQTREDIKSGKIEMVSHNKIWGNIKQNLAKYQ